MNVQNGYENSLNDYVNKEKIAVDLINSIGSLMYEKGIELVLFRQHLVNINISELMNCFDYAKDVVFKPLDISLVNDLVKEIYKMDLAPSKLDIGKLTFEYTEQKNSFDSISVFLNTTDSAILFNCSFSVKTVFVPLRISPPLLSENNISFTSFILVLDTCDMYNNS